jgi:hypothetical protein
MTCNEKETQNIKTIKTIQYPYIRYEIKTPKINISVVDHHTIHKRACNRALDL